MDKEHLIKLLNLTTSRNDGEALSAIRKTNIFLKENDVNWEKILEEKPKKIESDILYMNHFSLKKERAYLRELETNFKFSKKIIKILSLIIVILIAVIILK